ncbi:MAG: hypothetical protein ABH839_00245 [Chloroflexota bacterium]
MIVQALKDIQGRDGLSDRELARRIDVHRVSWSRIKTGRAPFGVKFLSGVRRAFPELKDEIDIFLAANVTAINSKVTIGNKGRTRRREKRGRFSLRRLCRALSRWRREVFG